MRASLAIAAALLSGIANAQFCSFSVSPNLGFNGFLFPPTPVGSSSSITVVVTPAPGRGPISFTLSTPGNQQITRQPGSITTSNSFNLIITFRPVREQDFGWGINIAGTQPNGATCSTFIGGGATGTPGFIL